MAKDEEIKFRVTEKQKKAIAARAKDKGMTVAEYLRYLALVDIEKNS
jgi:predicted DNA binding CopG/RHH family protein